MTVTPRSSVRDILWPAVAVGGGATALGLAFQLEQSQWWSAEELLAHQYWQLAALLRHARATVPFYQKRLADTGMTDEQALTPEGWLRIPLLTRQDIRQHQADLTTTDLPSGHGPIHRNKTSGSTGQSLEVLGTAVDTLMWQGLTLRDDLWHQRDYSGRLVAIHSGRYQQDPLAVSDFPTWGLKTPLLLYKTGPMTVFYHLTPIPRQAELLEARSPQYLAIYPSNARALCRYARRRPVRLPDLKAVLTFGEPVPEDVRTACRETWGVPVHDIYCCEELGYIAMQCPSYEHYHVPSETILVEILDEQGRPCAAGQLGRAVLTPLHSFAMPLIRYAIGDYAEVGRPCLCGRGLPVLQRVLGRQRNRVVLPDGSRTWPDISTLWAALTDVEQIQLIQRSQDHVEVRYAREQPLSPAEEYAGGQRIHQALGYPFRLMFTRQGTIARQPNGKYETFFVDFPGPPRWPGSMPH
jgi:phenylacetate-CoA ligase